jgi:murein DD-endopeptidase MepM/ murein hydrolase activator NlpD
MKLQIYQFRYAPLLILLLFFSFIHNAIAATADSFRYPVGSADGTGWLGNKGGYQWLDYAKYDCGYVYHPGIDFNKDGTSGNGDLDQPVYAIANGRVIFSGAGGSSWGDIMLIEHTLPNGTKVWSQYGHVKNRSVSSGSTVSKGQQIAKVGNANGAWHAHLHFEIRKTSMSAGSFPCGKSKSYVETNYYDPHSFIKSRFNPGIELKDFWKKETSIYSGATNGFDAQFKLYNGSGKIVGLEAAYLSLHDAGGNFIKDMKAFPNINIANGETWKTGIVYTNTNYTNGTALPAGTYRVVAKIDENKNGYYDGRHLDEKTFTVLASSTTTKPNAPCWRNGFPIQCQYCSTMDRRIN